MSDVADSHDQSNFSVYIFQLYKVGVIVTTLQFHVTNAFFHQRATTSNPIEVSVQLNLQKQFQFKWRPAVFKALTTKPSWLRSKCSTKASTKRTGLSSSIFISKVENIIWLRLLPLIKFNFQELFSCFKNN